MAPFMMLVSRTSTAPDVTHAGHSVASPAPAAAVEAALRGFAVPRWPSAARSIIFEALVKVKLPPVRAPLSLSRAGVELGALGVQIELWIERALVLCLKTNR